MLRITIELLPHGDEARARHMGTATISATRKTVDGLRGDYDVVLSKWGRPSAVWKRGTVEGFRRKRFGPWDLLLCALLATIGKRLVKLLAPGI